MLIAIGDDHGLSLLSGLKDEILTERAVLIFSSKTAFIIFGRTKESR